MHLGMVTSGTRARSLIALGHGHTKSQRSLYHITKSNPKVPFAKLFSWLCQILPSDMENAIGLIRIVHMWGV